MIHLLIVDEIRLMCNVLAAALSHEPDISVVGCATTVGEAMARVPEADVVLMSRALPGINPLDLTHAMVRAKPTTKVLMIGVLDSEEAILQCMEAGAAGYILQEGSIDGLLKSIRSIHSGDALLKPEIVSVL